MSSSYEWVTWMSHMSGNLRVFGSMKALTSLTTKNKNREPKSCVFDNWTIFRELCKRKTIAFVWYLFDFLNLLLELLVWWISLFLFLFINFDFSLWRLVPRFVCFFLVISNFVCLFVCLKAFSAHVFDCVRKNDFEVLHQKMLWLLCCANVSLFVFFTCDNAISVSEGWSTEKLYFFNVYARAIS